MNQPQLKKVELKSRPELDLYVKSISALEDCALREQLTGENPNTASGEKTTMAKLLAGYVVNPDGTPAFASTEEALAFMGTAKRNVCWKLIREGQKFNELTDEAIEKEEKN